MRIICLNGWGGKMHEALLAYVATAAPDVLCLQEVVHSPASDKDWLTYRDGDHVLPQRANFFHDVCEVLPDHLATFCPAAEGILWDEDLSVPSQWGLATFVHKSLPVIGQLQDFVHKDYSPDGYGEHPRSRVAHGIRVHDSVRGHAVSITHMHGLRDLNGKMDTPDRDAQARRLLEISQTLSRPGDLTIICGDFNVEPESATLQRLATAGFTELVTRRGFATTRTALYRKPGKFADYMLIDQEDAVRHFDVACDPAVSDHCALVLEI